MDEVVFATDARPAALQRVLKGLGLAETLGGIAVDALDQ
jgi:hypothetical protein